VAKAPLNPLQCPPDLRKDEVFVQLAWRFRPVGPNHDRIGASHACVTVYKGDMPPHLLAKHLRGLADSIEKANE